MNKVQLFKENAHLLSEDMNKAIANNDVAFHDGAVFHKAMISGKTEITTLMKSGQNLTKGQSSFTDGKLQQGTNIMVTTVGLGIGVTEHATLASVNPLDALYSMLDSAAIPSIAHCEIVISQGSTNKFRALISDCLLGVGSDKANGKSGFQLISPFVLTDQSPVQITLDFPDGVTVPNEAIKKYFLGTTLIGVITTKK